MLAFHQDRDPDEQHHDDAVFCGCTMWSGIFSQSTFNFSLYLFLILLLVIVVHSM